MKKELRLEFIKKNMKSLLSYIKNIYYNKLLPSENVYEMATISRNEKFGKDNYRVSIHGPASADRENPHIHIYLANDIIPYNKFNFEISLTDILCKDEINLIYQRDIRNHVMRSNRSKCSWDGYKNLLYDFEDWLFNENVKKAGDFIDNLHALIFFYNDESPYTEQNSLLKYIKDHGLKILNEYEKYFSEEDKEKYKECFN